MTFHRCVTLHTAALLLLAGARASAAPAPPGAFTLRRGPMRFHYDLRSGTASASWNGARKIAGLYSAARSGATLYTSRGYARRAASVNGASATVTLTDPGKPTMVQRFSINVQGCLLVQVELRGHGLSSNWMAPVMLEGSGCVSLGRGRLRALRVPFDNDLWVRYDASPVLGSGTSYEVAAFFDDRSRNGLVIGSVAHDTWKTGITFDGHDGAVTAVRAFGGIADAVTHDVVPHGALRGDRLVSPKMMVGYFADWRGGMEAFADANAAEAPMLRWGKGVPFGWNSWGKIQKDITFDKAAAVSDFVARSLQARGFQNGGAVYINLDSWWDRLTDDELKRFVERVHTNGQKAGIYWTPFVYWLGDLNRTMEGSTYRYGDAVLRRADGAPIAANGGIAIDPTHPGNLRRMDAMIDRLKALGFEYIKLDFLTHGAFEGGARNGVYYDPSVHTGIQAYNLGMRHLLKRIGGTMFISESIAPLFPYRYAHARRVSCDTFGAISETEYEVNSAAYAWWMSGRLYAYNDPDHMVLEGHRPNENQSRVTSAAVSGTVYLNGDDLTRPEAQRLAERWLLNGAVNGVARLGRAFRPVDAAEGTKAPDALSLRAGTGGYLALFNFNGSGAAERRIDLARAGFSGTARYTVTDLWTGRAWTASGMLEACLEPAQSTILSLKPATAPDGARPAP